METHHDVPSFSIYKIDIAEAFHHPDIECGICHHPEDTGQYPMFGKLEVDSNSHLGTNNTPILTMEFWKKIIPLSVETLCKLASVTETDPPRAIDLGYKHSFMQKWMESQLNDMGGTAVKKREIN